jgi:hypothetical protein
MAQLDHVAQQDESLDVGEGVYECPARGVVAQDVIARRGAEVQV